MADVKILIVDDEEDIREMLRMVLRREHWAIEEASSGTAALEGFRTHQPDLVVLDYMMPGLTGLEAARQMRSEGASCPIILYSAYLSPQVETEARSLDVLPVSKSELVPLVETVRREVAGRKRSEAFVHLLQEIIVAANEAIDIEDALRRCMEAVCRQLTLPVSHALLRPPATTSAHRSIWHVEDPERFSSLRKATEVAVPSARGLIGRVMTSARATWITAMSEEDDALRRSAAIEAGLRSGFAFPVVVGGEVAAVVEFFSSRPDEPDQDLLAMMGHAGTQLARVVERSVAMNRERELSERLTLILSSTGEGICGLDLEGRCTFVNRSAAELLGYGAEELFGRRFHEVVHHTRSDGSPYPVNECPIQLAMLSARTCRVDDEVFWRKDGTSFAADYSAHPIQGDGQLTGAVLAFSDISDRKALEEQLKHRAFHDSLTGLANRALFQDRLAHALLVRRGQSRLMAVLLIDLDNFKTVNDSLGHSVGDALLVSVAKRLATSLRSGDTAARLGGDEFAILVDDLNHPNEAAEVAARILKALEGPFELEDRHISVRASVGIAVADAERSADELLRNADLAMYAAKREGKGRHVSFDAALHDAALDRLEMEGDLRRSLESGDGSIFLEYQPIVSLTSSRVAGAEALVRWDHPRRGLLPPAAFIPVAEESGLIIPLGRWVLREACGRLSRWQSEMPFLGSFTMSVNLSPRQLREPHLVDEVRSALAEFGLEPGHLVLEITENVLIENSERAVDRLAELKEVGVGVAIDDFGTGYSSLSYLQRLPIDALKVDRSFIAQLGNEVEDTAVAQAILKLARTFNLRTVAEGIETQDQGDMLKELGCQLGQGYHFSRPLSSGALTALLHSQEP